MKQRQNFAFQMKTVFIQLLIHLFIINLFIINFKLQDNSF